MTLEPAAQNALRAAGVLLVAVVLATALLALAYRAMLPSIEHNQREAERARIAEVLPVARDTPGLLLTMRRLPADALLGTRAPSQAWIASARGQPFGVVLEAVAPDGYGGGIALLIGIDAHGAITGVRVTTHHETPGIGDYIAGAQRAWLTQFDGRSLTSPPSVAWKVRQDGGAFDARAGATLSARAVVKSLHATLEYFARHRANLLDSAGFERSPKPRADVGVRGTEIAFFAVN